MKVLILLSAILSSQAFACWNLKGEFSVNENKVSINQKVDHDKSYSFASGNFIYNIKVSNQALKHLVEVDVQEKIGLNLKTVSRGQMLVKTNKEGMMTKKDEETNQLTTLKVTLTEI